MIRRVFGYSVKNILRNTFLSISSILVLTLLMFFINILMLLNTVSVMLIDVVNEKMSMVLYLKQEYNDVSVEVVSLMEDVKNISTDIRVEYQDKEKIVDSLEQRFVVPMSIIKQFNPGGSITISNISLPDYKSVNDSINKWMFVLEKNNKYDFSTYMSQYKNIQKITSVLSSLKTWLIILIVVFFVSIAIISYNVISNFIYYYKDEIYITQLVGGANIFIYGPFVFQGIIYAVISFFLNILIFNPLLQYASVMSISYGLPPIDVPVTWFVGELVIFIIIGAVSGYFSSIGHIGKTLSK